MTQAANLAALGTNAGTTGILPAAGGGTAGTGGAIAFKNRIINGNMVLDQRNAGASITPTTGVYCLDRWFAVAYSASSKFSVQQNAGSVTPPVGFSNYIGITSTSAYSVAAGDFLVLQQNIEGYNIADLAWGTASAKTVTLSFWVRSSLTGTFGGAVSNNDGSKSYPYTYTISAANTWEYKSITVPGCPDGTWQLVNNLGISLRFALGVGSTYTGTAGAWATGANYFTATGAINVVATSGATLYFTGVQFEVGTAATNFDVRSFGTELALCQRYFNSSFPIGTAPADAAGGGLGSTNSYAQNYFTVAIFQFPVAMRAAPTVTYYNPAVSSSDKIRDASGFNYPAYSQAGPTTTGVGVGVSGTNFNGGGTFGFTNYSASAEL